MAGSKVDIEPGNESMDEIAAPTIQRKGGLKSQIGGRDSVEIDGEDGSGVGNDSFHFDGINKWLGQGAVFQRRKVKPVDIVPDYEKSACPLLMISVTCSQFFRPCIPHLQYRP